MFYGQEFKRRTERCKMRKYRLIAKAKDMGYTLAKSEAEAMKNHKKGQWHAFADPGKDEIYAVCDTDYATRIKEYREREDVTQHKLAQMLGISVMTIIRWELKRSEPSALARRKLREKKVV